MEAEPKPRPPDDKRTWCPRIIASIRKTAEEGEILSAFIDTQNNLPSSLIRHFLLDKYPLKIYILLDYFLQAKGIINNLIFVGRLEEVFL